jgi:squalene-hopene/tetraprenyl-beta-curcumene cyclase
MRAPLMREPPRVAVSGVDASLDARLDDAIADARRALLDAQQPDGHWVFELEADCTIPAEYIALLAFLDEQHPAREAAIGRYLRARQGEHGGWPLVHGGPFNMSASVKAYYALRLIGDRPDAPHMQRAREAILAHGGAGTANVFTRILLALHGVLKWSAVPVIPVEIMLLPRWSPFHLARVSYWTRTVLVPLFVLAAKKPRARNTRGVRLDELFHGGRPRARTLKRAPHQARLPFAFFCVADVVLRACEPLVPGRIREWAIGRAVAFVEERLNGEDGLGAIFPAMANAVMMFEALGYPRDAEPYRTARRAVDNLLVEGDTESYCQPCVSPVWDTALACHALLETGDRASLAAVGKGLAWLARRQVRAGGDWQERRPGVPAGGWAFQYANPHYPDLDDTAVVVMAMDRYVRSTAAHGSPATLRESIALAHAWVAGLQSGNGGWGAFDADNTAFYLNHIPFADHGALLDPPTADVTARCVGMLAQLGLQRDRKAIERALAYLDRTQENDGSWYGRWGMNYVYGTWSVLCALNATGGSIESASVRRAVDWLLAAQNEDGGWGETAQSYELARATDGRARSTSSQTAWALLGLMAAGATHHPACERGVAYLLRTQNVDGFWTEQEFTATGFPRVFFLRYHGYARYFPLWALARYRALAAEPAPRVRYGM